MMRNLLPVSAVCACVPIGMCVCVLMQSCERELLIQPQHPVSSPRSESEASGLDQVPWQIISADQAPHVSAKLKPYLKQYGSTRAETVLNIDSIYTDYFFMVSVPDSINYPDSTLLNYPDSTPETPIKVYSMFVGSDIPNTLFNIYLEEFSDGTLSDPYVLMYRMDSTFAEAYYANTTSFDEFTGALSKHEMEVMFGNIFRSGEDLAYLAKCWEIVFGEPLDIVIPGYINPSYPGGPGGGPNAPTNRPGGIGTVIPGGGSYPSTGCWRVRWIGPNTLEVYWDETCNDGPYPMALWGDSDNSGSSRSPYLACVRFLIMCGFLDKAFTPDPSQLSAEEFLAIELGFDMDDPDFDDILTCLQGNKKVYVLIQELLDDLIDPCNPQNSAEKMLHDAVAAGCGNGGGLSEEEVLDELGNQQDYIILHNIDKSPRLMCMWEKLKDFGLCGEIVQSFEELQGTFDLVQVYDYNGTFSGLNYNPDGSFSGNQSDYADTYVTYELIPGTQDYLSQTQTNWNKYFPDLPPIVMASYFIHEMLHNEFFRWIYTSGNPLMESDFNATSNIWRDIVIEKYGTDAPTNHHQLMNYFVDRITEDLWEMNGETDPTRKDYYKYFAYDLFHTDEGLVSAGFLTQTQLDYYKNLNSQILNNIDCP